MSLLYVFASDSPGKSSCNAGCDSAWPPLLAREHAVGAKVGEWIVIARDDGRRQWAYRGKPVYMAYHDLGQSAKELSASGFHLLEP
jgi:predicted lipoprotein with Yx(FWY)xxD motif